MSTMDPKPQETYLANGRVMVEYPRLMRDEELAAILEEFVQSLKARLRKESVHVTQPEPPPPSNLPFKRKPPKRWR
jgi:hypothetical protein